MASSRILLTGGGTSGHVNPAIAIGRALGDEQTSFLFVGVRGRAEGEVVPREGIPIRFVRATAFPGLRLLPAWGPFLLNLGLGMLKAPRRGHARRPGTRRRPDGCRARAARLAGGPDRDASLRVTGRL